MELHIHTIPWGHMGSEITTIFLEKENLVPRGFRQRAKEEDALCTPLATMWAEARACVHTRVLATTVQWLSDVCLAPGFLKEVCCGIF